MPGARPVVAALALLAVAIGVLLWSRTEVAPPAPAPAALAPADATVSAATATPPSARENVVTPATTTTEAPVQVRGRCLAAEDGRGVAAVLRIGSDDGAMVDEPGALAHKALASVTADAEGHFAVAVPLATACDLRVHAEAPDRAPAGARQTEVAPGSTWDLGTILLQRTARVRGEVVDASAAPVDGAEVGLVMLGHEPPALQFRESHTALTDARGAFTFAAPVAAGEWYVRCERTGALRTPRKIQVPAGGELVVRIEVERPDPALSLHGTVVDRDGAPLAGVELSAYGEGSRGNAVSGADGTFVVPKGPPHFDRGDAGVEVQASALGYEQASPSKRAARAWGEHGLRVVMRPLGDFVVRARDARGATVWPFQLTVGKCTASGQGWLPRGLAAQRTGPDHMVLPRLPGGRYALVLTPRDGALATAGPVPFVVDEASAGELVVQVPDRIDATVEVVDGTGAPVVGCRVELVASLTALPTDAEAPAPDLAAARRASAPGPRQLAVVHGVTDAQGRVVLPAAPGAWLLRARCTTHRPAAQPIVVAAGAAAHRLVLTPAAMLRGRLAPADVLPALGLGQQKAERRLAVLALVGKDTVARAEVAADGAFDLGPLPTAEVELHLATWLAANAVANTTMPHRLGTLDGNTPGVVERSFDVAAFVPATASGLVLWDGQPLRHGQFFLRRLQPEPVRYVRIPTDGEGRFRTLVPPGELGPQLAIPSDPGPGHVVFALGDRWTVAPGQAVELRIASASRRLRLRLLQPDGTPLAATRCQLAADGYQRPGPLTSDAGGRVDVPLAPHGPFTVTAKDSAGRELRGSVAHHVPDDAVLDVPLAPAPR